MKRLKIVWGQKLSKKQIKGSTSPHKKKKNPLYQSMLPIKKYRAGVQDAHGGIMRDNLQRDAGKVDWNMTTR